MFLFHPQRVPGRGFLWLSLADLEPFRQRIRQGWPGARGGAQRSPPHLVPLSLARDGDSEAQQGKRGRTLQVLLEPGPLPSPCGASVSPSGA